MRPPSAECMPQSSLLRCKRRLKAASLSRWCGARTASTHASCTGDWCANTGHVQDASSARTSSARMVRGRRHERTVVVMRLIDTGADGGCRAGHAVHGLRKRAGVNPARKHLSGRRCLDLHKLRGVRRLPSPCMAAAFLRIRQEKGRQRRRRC